MWKKIQALGILSLLSMIFQMWAGEWKRRFQKTIKYHLEENN